ncbi:hypothetical protein GA0070624_5439 [Micromonospora rhizosphaerae]|uniref:Uncharacterized protein n=2 Tax=Micromonospora rhizosphaerae TaxID=568872 RepID=A0A1C6T3P2_9ACTN|nr:hypothetical protein GA0070624_5439 [Micromonospora rhizosphaerae]
MRREVRSPGSKQALTASVLSLRSCAPGGYVSVRQRDHDGYTVLIWAGDELEAWGITPRLDDIVTTMRSWQADQPVQALTEASPYLTAVDQQTAVDILWGLLSGNSDPHVARSSLRLRPIRCCAPRDRG